MKKQRCLVVTCLVILLLSGCSTLPESQKKTNAFSQRDNESFYVNMRQVINQSRHLEMKETEKIAMAETNPVTTKERDELRQHISKCWNPPISAKDVQDLKIEIRISMNPDGTVRAASIPSRKPLNPFYQAAVESALRAVNNRNCWPYPLSPDNYILWEKLTVIFDPKELLGL